MQFSQFILKDASTLTGRNAFVIATSFLLPTAQTGASMITLHFNLCGFYLGPFDLPITLHAVRTKPLIAEAAAFRTGVRSPQVANTAVNRGTRIRG